jgi:zinc transporter
MGVYMVSLVAGVFLPLDFVTGLLGMNLGFIPWTSEPWAFTAVCAFLGAIVAFELWLFRRFQWI